MLLESKYLTAPPIALRVRPTDRPVWVDASTDASSFSGWRTVASDFRIPVDALVAVLLEWAAVTAIPGIAVDALVEFAGSQPTFLPPTQELRAWDRQLAGRGQLPNYDELPEVCLPVRVVACYGHTLRIATHIDLSETPQAIAADRAAARLGLTLEAWAMRAALGCGYGAPRPR